MGIVFGIIFLVTVLVIACVVLGILAEQTMHRAALFGAAVLLVSVTAAGCWVTLSQEENPEATAVSEPASTPEKEKGPAVNPSGNGVILVVDESTISKDQDEENSAALAIEKTPVNSADNPQQKKERQRLSRQLCAVEQALANSAARLSAQMAAVDQQFQMKQLSNYEALFQKSTLKIKQEELVITAMEKKLKLLQSVEHLTERDTGPDIGRVEKRLARAREKREEYRGVLAELSANSEVFKNL